MVCLRRPKAVALIVAVAVISMAASSCVHSQTAVTIRAADGGLIAADTYGSGDRAVILAHGGRFDRTGWKDQGRELAAAGFRVLAIDFRAAVEARAGCENACLYDEACLAKDVLMREILRFLTDP